MNSPHHKIIATKSLIASLMLLCVLSCSAEEHIRFFRRSAGMVSIDTRSNKMRSCNSVPFWHDYIEVFLCKDKNDTFWGALRNDKGNKGYLQTRYDANTGKKLMQIQLPDLKKMINHEIACFPEHGKMVYTCSHYHTDYEKTDIVLLNMTTGMTKVIAEYPPKWLCGAFRINAGQLLIVIHTPDKETSFVFYDLLTGKTEKAVLPYHEICHIHAVSPDGSLILASTFRRLFLYDIKKRKVSCIITQDGISYEGDFSPDSRSIIFAMSRNGNSELYRINDLTADDPPELQTVSNEKYDFFSPRFFDASTIVYRNSPTGFFFPCCTISFFDLKQKKTVKKYAVSSIWSPLFVVGKHLVFVM